MSFRNILTMIPLVSVPAVLQPSLEMPNMTYSFLNQMCIPVATADCLHYSWKHFMLSCCCKAACSSTAWRGTCRRYKAACSSTAQRGRCRRTTSSVRARTCV